MTTRQRHEQQSRTYRALIGVAEEVVGERTNGVGKDRARSAARTCSPIWPSRQHRGQIEHYCGLGSRVIDQARRRVLEGEQVPNAEKIYSIFEPHTDLIKRGKVRTPIEFGHKVFLAESAQGLITQYEVLKGNPVDEIHVTPSLQRHRKAFGRAPELYGSDRGFFSEQNVMHRAGAVSRSCAFPQRGGKKTPEREAYEKGADFKARPALSRRHRGPHLGPVPRSRNEALPRRGKRTIRIVGGRRRAALLWQILSGTGFPNQFFNDSWVVGFWRADHGWQDVGLERRAWTLAQAVSGSVGS